MPNDDGKAGSLFVEVGRGGLPGGDVVVVEGAAVVVEVEKPGVCVASGVVDPGSTVVLWLGGGRGGGGTFLDESSLEFPSSCRL